MGGQLPLRQGQVSIVKEEAIGRKILSLHHLPGLTWYVWVQVIHVPHPLLRCLLDLPLLVMFGSIPCPFIPVLPSAWTRSSVSNPHLAAPLQWAAIFQKDDINFTQGHHDLTWYDAPSKKLTHELPCKVSCSYCRTPIMDEGRNMILLYPGLIKDIEKKENREYFRPQ